MVWGAKVAFQLRLQPLMVFLALAATVLGAEVLKGLTQPRAQLLAWQAPLAVAVPLEERVRAQLLPLLVPLVATAAFS